MKYLLLLFLFPIACLVANPEQTKTHLPERKTICLNMIVKNESEVILDCLRTVKPFIDYWVIFDTGSTDGTQTIIQSYLKDIPGELHESPWVNFSHNRNEALAAAKDKADYILFIDADEVLDYANHFTLPHLDRDVYYYTVRQIDAADCKRVLLVNSALNWQWEGVLHEALKSDAIQTAGFLEGIVNVCNTTQRGARAKDTATRANDITILKEAIAKEPANSRYVYYLGITYLATEQYKLALETFQKRVAMESSAVEETYLARISHKLWKNLEHLFFEIPRSSFGNGYNHSLQDLLGISKNILLNFL
ncbi:MAG: glycosyltransferase, partial [Chlamydiota bacterium]